MVEWVRMLKCVARCEGINFFFYDDVGVKSILAIVYFILRS